MNPIPALTLPRESDSTLAHNPKVAGLNPAPANPFNKSSITATVAALRSGGLDLNRKYRASAGAVEGRLCYTPVTNMHWLRLRVWWLVPSWLLCQVVVMTASPSALCFELSRASATAECTCSHDDGKLCPMHHTRGTRVPLKSDCGCRSTADPAAALLQSLLGPTAEMTDVSRHAAPLSSSALHPVSVLQPLNPFVIPDGPPPRA
jgi:hypothetical protein